MAAQGAADEYSRGDPIRAQHHPVIELVAAHTTRHFIGRTGQAPSGLCGARRVGALLTQRTYIGLVSLPSTRSSYEMVPSGRDLSSPVSAHAFLNSNGCRMRITPFRFGSYLQQPGYLPAPARGECRVPAVYCRWLRSAVARPCDTGSPVVRWACTHPKLRGSAAEGTKEYADLHVEDWEA